MRFNASEKEFIRTLVKGKGSVKFMADVINQNKIFENRDIAIVRHEGDYVLFYNTYRYGEEETEAMGYVGEIMSLIDLLVKNRYIIPVPVSAQWPDMIGKKYAQWQNIRTMYIDGGESISVFGRTLEWTTKNPNKYHWFFHGIENRLKIENYFFFSFTVSQELRDYVKNGFKTIEDIRFRKQQIATWVSIGVAVLLGLAGIFR